MTAAKVRETVVIAVCHTCNMPAYAAERDVLIAAAQIIRACTMDELLCISATTADAGDLWGAKVLADAEIVRREVNVLKIREAPDPFY